MNDLQLALAAGLSVLAILTSLAGLLSLIRHRRAASKPKADSAADEPLPYRLVEAFLTPSERALYSALRPAAVAHGADIFARVHLEDLVQVRKGAADYQAHRERIRACCIDLVLCDRERLVPLLALQMASDGRKRDSQREHDEFLGRVLADLALPLVYLPAQSSYDPDDIAAIVSEQIDRPQVAGHAEADEPDETPAMPWQVPAPASPWFDVAPPRAAEGSEEPLGDASSEAGLGVTTTSSEPGEAPLAEAELGDVADTLGSPAHDAAPDDGLAPGDGEMPAYSAATPDDEAQAPVDGTPVWEEPPVAPSCPACGQPLVEMQDTETGVIVLACAGYPDCPHVQAR